ncbi:MAG TPA: sigma-70 family RNA polymerase sigma factor [Fimbriiglobus sp.]
MNPFPRLLQSAGEAVPDAVLVRRFVAERDHAAFELLVRRHADAVWTACRRILRHDADAEDAFQAAFLALARKAGKIRETGTLAGWLYKVAVNAALKSRASRPKEVPLAEVELPARQEQVGPAHEELARLSDKYRLPVVLCDLEGHTHAEAAAVLGWPVGTVAGRLSRARDQLKTRLLRRGIVGPVVLAAVVADSSLAGRAAAVALGSSAASLTVSTLTEGVLAAMSTFKLKLTAAVAASLIFVAGTGTYLAMGQPPAPKAERKTQIPVVAGQGSVVSARKVQKLKDGRLTAYPELVFEFSKEYKTPEPGSFGTKPAEHDGTPESDILQLRLERVRQLNNVFRLDYEVMQVGNWDVPFLNQYLENLDTLQLATKEAYPSASDRIYWLRNCL